jgi:hypothetical protein
MEITMPKRTRTQPETNATITGSRRAQGWHGTRQGLSPSDDSVILSDGLGPIDGVEEPTKAHGLTLTIGNGHEVFIKNKRMEITDFPVVIKMEGLGSSDLHPFNTEISVDSTGQVVRRILRGITK